MTQLQKFRVSVVVSFHKTNLMLDGSICGATFALVDPFLSTVTVYVSLF